MLTVRRSAIALIAAGFAVATLTAPASFASPTSAPFQSSTCFTSACVWSPNDGAYVAGGDGVSITDYMGGNWGSLEPIAKKSAEIEEVAAGELPALEWTIPLGTLTLAPTAFAFGWEIGSAIETKWLRLDGPTLGVTTTALPSIRWAHHPKINGSVLPAGWVLGWGSWEPFTDRDYGCGSAGELASVRAYAAAVATAGAQKVFIPVGDPAHVVGCLGNLPEWKWVIPDPNIFDALPVTTPPQPYTNQQPVTGSTGWSVPGSCGDVTWTCSFPGGQAHPALSQPKFRCQLSGDAADCGTTKPHTCVSSDLSGYFGGAGSTGCGLGDAAENEANCIADPADFACPLFGPGGAGFGSSGGYNGSDDTITGAGDDPCKFDDDLGGLDAWNALNASGAYDQDCLDAWQAMQDAGYIASTGEPTPLATQAPEKLIRADQLGNQAVKDAMLQMDPGSDLTQWFKVSTPPLKTADGVPYEVHWYQNLNDGTLYLGRDYFLVFKQLF